MSEMERTSAAQERKPRGKRGDGVVFKRGSVLWVRYYAGPPGKRERIEESSGSANERVARNLLRTRLADVQAGRPAPVTRRCTFEDLVGLLRDDYLVNGRRSLRRALLAVEHLRGTFGRDLATSITTDRIVAYQAARLAAGAAPASVHIELAALKRMLRLAGRHGRVHQVPDFENPTPNNARKGFFEEDDLRRVLEHLPEYLRPLVLFAYHTGWRRGEVVGLRWSQVDLNARTVRLEPGTTKNQDGRLFPLAPGSEPEAVLREQREQTTALERTTSSLIPHVFHRGGQPIRDFYRAWRSACRKAGVPGRIFHDFRRTAVRNLERAGVPRSWAKKLTGHKTDSVYQRYAIVDERDLRDGVARLAAWQQEHGRRKEQQR